MLSKKPNHCYSCSTGEHIIQSSTALFGGGGKSFWYCRGCKQELDDGGFPPLPKETLFDLDNEDFINELIGVSGID